MFSLNIVFIMFPNLCDYYLCNLMSGICYQNSFSPLYFPSFFVMGDEIGTWKIAADCLRRIAASRQLDEAAEDAKLCGGI